MINTLGQVVAATIAPTAYSTLDVTFATGGTYYLLVNDILGDETLKEDFQLLWDYRSVYWAGWFLDRWCTRAMRSRIEPMKKIARSMREHRPLILNWFRARGEILGGAVEGLNNKLKLVTRRAYGFRSFRVIEVALYHTLGGLPEPEGTHRFC